MKTTLKFAGGIALVVLVTIGIFSFTNNEKPIKFVSMAALYQNCNLKKSYQKKLAAFEEESNNKLLKLDEQIKQKQIEGTSPEEISFLRNELLKTRELLSAEYQKRSEKYDAEIWAILNKEIEVYGKEHGYKFILGATGNGAIMYADDSEDITEELSTYINQ